MNGFQDIDALERWQGRVFRWMVGASVLGHAAVLFLGTSLSAWFPSPVPAPVVTVELTDAPPMTELPEEMPTHPLAASAPAGKSPPRAARPSTGQRFLRRIDTGLAKVQDAPIAIGSGRTGDIPVRRWEDRAMAGPGDLAPAVAPEDHAFRKHIARIEGKIRASGEPGIDTSEEADAAMTVGKVGDAEGEPIPPWIRDMIRRKVREHLPELEASYSAAFRKNPELSGRLLVRFRIDPSGKIRNAEPVERSFSDEGFVRIVLGKILRWTFDPTDGRAIEVLYPFVFRSPS